MLPGYEPVRIGTLLLTLEKFELAGQWVPAFAGKTTRRMRKFRFFHDLGSGGPGWQTGFWLLWVPAFAGMTQEGIGYCLSNSHR